MIFGSMSRFVFLDAQFVNIECFVSKLGSVDPVIDYIMVGVLLLCKKY